MIEEIAQQLIWINQIVDLVWLILTSIMVYLAINTDRQKGVSSRSFVTILFLIATVYAYPIYTIGFQLPVIGLLGNLFTIAITTLAFWQLQKTNVTGAWLLNFQNIWLILASICLYAQITIVQRS